MSGRALFVTALVCALIALISIFTVDQPIAMAVHNSGYENTAFFDRGREFLDVFTGRGLVGNQVGLGQFLLGALIMATGLIWLAIDRKSFGARAMIFTIATQWATIEIGWQIKEIFGRMRPFQLIEKNDWSHMWFMGSNSFPSGHNAFFWGLFVPLMYLFPKWRIPLLIVPVFIALARIDENYHFLSDVLASIALACLITLLAAFIGRRWIYPYPARAV